MVGKSEQKERTREGILDAASKLVRERGIVGARVADVMAAAGLTVGGFYAHFESKTALVDETLRRTGDLMRERLFAGIDDKPEEDRAEVIVKRYVSVLHRDEEALGCTLPAVAGEIGTTAPEHGRAIAAQVDAFAAALEKRLPHGVPHKRHVALGLVAAMVGGITLARATRGTDLSDELLRATRALAKLALRSPERESKEKRS
jgi:TetR/AcrR family transcriptional repressor of nem operon